MSIRNNRRALVGWFSTFAKCNYSVWFKARFFVCFLPHLKSVCCKANFRPGAIDLLVGTSSLRLKSPIAAISRALEAFFAVLHASNPRWKTVFVRCYGNDVGLAGNRRSISGRSKNMAVI